MGAGTANQAALIRALVKPQPPPPLRKPFGPLLTGYHGNCETQRIGGALTLESHSFRVLTLMKDTSPLAPVITASCSQRTIRSMSSPSFQWRYLSTEQNSWRSGSTRTLVLRRTPHL